MSAFKKNRLEGKHNEITCMYNFVHWSDEVVLGVKGMRVADCHEELVVQVMPSQSIPVNTQH